MAKFVYNLLKVLIKLELISKLMSDSFVLCAPLPTDELCSVNLVPNELIAKRFRESVIAIKCEATLIPKLLSESFHFTNPVFDLSFGGAPRTGVFILRGNTTCDGLKVKCWSQYEISANSIGHLIHHSGNIIYSCQVADQLRNDNNNKTLARCKSTGTLGFINTLNYGDPCSTKNTDQECDKGMECGAPDTENENEVEGPQQCICKNGLVSIPISFRNTICVEEVPLDSICNYTKQCSAVDSNSICDYNKNGIKVCQCSQDSYEFTEYQTDYIKKCRIRPKTTTTTTTSTTASTEEDESQDITTIITPENNIMEPNKSDYRVTPNKDKAGNVGIILFFVAIFLAIIIVVIIIRARNKSDKMVVNRKTIELQTDDNDGQQNEPILATDKSGGVDEVDDITDDEGVKSSYSNGEDEQIHNKINESQKIQTNV